MDVSFKSLGIDRLGLAERILLVEELWDSLAAEADALGIPQSHKDELDRRLAARDADLHSGSSWEDAKTRLQRQRESAP